MHALWNEAERVLRGESLPRGESAPGVPRLWALIGCVLCFGIAYGAVMGSFGGFSQGRQIQILYSGCKVPLLILSAFVLSLPSFFVLNTLFGLRADFGAAVRALLSTQAGLTIILASFAPFTAVWYCSFADYNRAILFNGVMFLAASLAAQGLLWRSYMPLISRDRKHLWLLRSWLFLYSFVAIQMAWLLRPFVGDPQSAPEFFRADSWGNAYLVVGGLIWRALGR